MTRPPRPRHEGVFTPGMVVLIAVVGTLAAVGVLLVFAWKLRTGEGTASAQTLAFTSLIMFEMFNAFNTRSEKYSIFSVGPFRNRWLIVAVLSSILLQVAVLYSPFLRPIFDVAPLNLVDWVVALVVGASALVGGEVGKRMMAMRMR